MKLRVLLLIGVIWSQLVFAEHAKLPAGVGAAVAAVATTCVCEYANAPVNCGAIINPRVCRAANRDCAWGSAAGEPAGCWNIHELYCQTEFAGPNARQKGCAKIVVVKPGGAPPACVGGNYKYTFHGHGPRLKDFTTTASNIIKASAAAPNCKFSFQDQTCETFAPAPGGINKARAVVNKTLMPLLKGRQEVTFAANQMVSTADYNAPYKMRNPHWAFHFDAKKISAETAISCDADLLCRHDGDVHLCWDKVAAGFRPRGCCCQAGMPGGGGPLPIPPPGGGLPPMPGAPTPPKPQQPSMPSYDPYRPYGDEDVYEDNFRPATVGDCRWYNQPNKAVANPVAATAGAIKACPAKLPVNPKDPQNWN